LKEQALSIQFEIPSHVRGLIFDCDGTIADTMPLHYKSWVTALGAHGVDFPEALFYELAGVPTPDIVSILNQRHGYHMPVQETADIKDGLFETLIPQVLPIQPVVAVVKMYAGKMPLAVATGGTRQVVEKTLRAVGLFDYFQAIVASGDVTRGKPAPDIYLEAARRIGVPPEDCCGFEDADLGMAAVRAAGMVAIDIRPMYSDGRNVQQSA
jgi:beta-phosphoglucomutase family hydrolase